MTGTTSAPWSVPYPQGTDRVADGDNAMQAIAERQTVIDNALPRGFITSSFVSLFQPGASSAQVLALAQFTTTEARDFMIAYHIRSKGATAGTGNSFDAKLNGTTMQNYICMPVPSGFDSDQVAVFHIPNVAAGAQAWTLWAGGYGATNNPVASARLTIFDVGASGSI